MDSLEHIKNESELNLESFCAQTNWNKSKNYLLKLKKLPQNYYTANNAE